MYGVNSERYIDKDLTFIEIVESEEEVEDEKKKDH